MIPLVSFSSSLILLFLSLLLASGVRSSRQNSCGVTGALEADPVSFI